MTFQELTSILLSAEIAVFKDALIKYLQEQGHTINDTNAKAQSLLHIILVNSKTYRKNIKDISEKINLLFQNKIHINTLDREGFTPLIVAIYDRELVEELIQNGANIQYSIDAFSTTNIQDLEQDMSSSHPLTILQEMKRQAQKEQQALQIQQTVQSSNAMPVSLVVGASPKPTELLTGNIEQDAQVLQELLARNSQKFCTSLAIYLEEIRQGNDTVSFSAIHDTALPPETKSQYAFQAAAPEAAQCAYHNPLLYAQKDKDTQMHDLLLYRQRLTGQIESSRPFIQAPTQSNTRVSQAKINKKTIGRIGREPRCSIVSSSDLHLLEFWKPSERDKKLGKIRTVVFADIDNTIITPKANMFRTGSQKKGLIDDLKKQQTHNMDRIATILSIWRFKRKVKLVSSLWPHVIKKLQREGALVYGLTQMSTGQVGCIENMQSWRYKELSSLQISFTPTYREQTEVEDLLNTGLHPNEDIAKFHHGIFMVGSKASKAMIVAQFLADNPDIHHVICFDDRSTEVASLRLVCEHYGVDYLGVVYREVEKTPGVPNPEIMALQETCLRESGEWLEDDEIVERFSLAPPQTAVAVQYGRNQSASSSSSGFQGVTTSSFAPPLNAKSPVKTERKKA